MTVLVGIRCTDGIVIGSDSIATSSAGPQPLIQFPFDGKIAIFAESIIIATTGSIGFSQRLHHHVAAAIDGGVFKNFDVRECCNNISKRFLTDLGNTNAYRHPQHGVGFGALMGCALKNEPCLVEFGTTDFQSEIKKEKLFFASMGSGQMLADPFLAFVTRVLWRGQMPTVDTGKFGVYWVLDHTIKHAPGMVGPPIRLATLRSINGKWVAQEQDTQESAQYIAELEEHIHLFVVSSIEIAEALPLPLPPKAS